jgi:K+-sensing histidine kinase KdpD
MIKSVIRNLIDNAVKNTTSGHISIRTNCLPDAQSCEIIIADEGKGMSNEDIVAINNYFQSSNGVQDFSASGFGHKVIRDFVSKLGGEIAYAPNTPSGIVVTLKLPVMNPFKAHEGPGSVALTMVSNNYNKDDVSRPC